MGLPIEDLQAEINLGQGKVSELYEKMYDCDLYFRDSYNATSVFWQLGLSWWNDLEDHVDDEYVLHPEGAKALLEIVESREIPAAEDLNLQHAADTDTPEGLEKWRDYFIEKKERFVAFLKKAINEDRTIACSV